MKINQLVDDVLFAFLDGSANLIRCFYFIWILKITHAATLKKFTLSWESVIMLSKSILYVGLHKNHCLLIFKKP